MRCVVLLLLLATPSSAVRTDDVSKVLATLASAMIDNKVSEVSVQFTEFKVAHYNILASYLGDNRMPWFLYPLPLEDSSRKAIIEKFYLKGPDGNYLNNFGNGFGGLLSEADRDQVVAASTNFDWEVRGSKVMGLIQSLDADILSLAELDRYADVKEKLGLDGYDSVFFKRPRRSSRDGSAVFWRKSRFEKVPGSWALKYGFDDWTPDSEKPTKDRVMVGVALKEHGTGKVIVAVSVHLMKSPEGGIPKDLVRMEEASEMMGEILIFMTQVHASAIVVLGDFNAMPTSWTTTLFEHGWPRFGEHAINITDAFEDLRKEQGAAACTSRTMARSMWIDYIFLSSGTLDLVSPEVEACPQGAIPDAQHPSDHLPIAAVLKFRAEATTQLVPLPL